MAYLILGIIVQSKNFIYSCNIVSKSWYRTSLHCFISRIICCNWWYFYVGVIDEIANIFVKFGSDAFCLYTIIVFASVILSAFIDNIPYVATMLPVVTGIAIHLVIDQLLYFGLLSGLPWVGLTPIRLHKYYCNRYFENGHEVPSYIMKISIPPLGSIYG